MFVLRRLTDGAYLTRPGAVNTHTHNLNAAWVFFSRQEAEYHCGEEEYLFPLGTHVLALAA